MLTINQTILTAIPNRQEFFISREFDAPCEKVFKAFTEARYLTQWLGPRGFVLTIDQFDCRTGGGYRYVHTDPQGNSYRFHGFFHEVSPNERIIQTFEFDGLPEKEHVSLEKTNFEALPGNRTKMTVQSIFWTVTDRDGMANADMEKGLNESYERLDELLATGVIQ